VSNRDGSIVTHLNNNASERLSTPNKTNNLRSVRTALDAQGKNQARF